MTETWPLFTLEYIPERKDSYALTLKPNLKVPKASWQQWIQFCLQTLKADREWLMGMKQLHCNSSLS